MTQRTFRAFFICVLLAGLAFRTADLSLRPMHHDEANQALKFGALLEKGEYRYDPAEHHGPALYYLTLPLARFSGARTTADLNETVLRLVPALFGTGTILLMLLFSGGLAREAIAFAGLAAALSPFMTYYSRFYIQETLLVFFATAMIAAGWRWVKRPSAWWAAAAGLSAGMAFACKETSLIVFAAAAVAVAGVLAWDRKRGGRHDQGGGERPAPSGRKPRGVFLFLHVLVFAAAAAATAWLFYSSFGKNPAGPLDAVKAIGIYLARGAQGLGHEGPFWYYLGMLAFPGSGSHGLWGEAFILFLAAAGAIGAFGHDCGKDGHPAFTRFILIYTVVLTVIFSAIPYKTPWNAMPFYAGMLLLAGSGAGLLWRVSRFKVIKIIILVLLLPGFFNLGRQNFRANFKYHSSEANPYAYAQTSPDFMKLVKRVEDVAAACPEGRGTLVVVAAPADETWPLPWYLRRFTRVGYWTGWDRVSAEARQAPIIIAPAAEADMFEKTSGGAAYVPSFYELRPGVLLDLAVRRDVWDLYMTSAGKAGGRSR